MKSQKRRKRMNKSSLLRNGNRGSEGVETMYPSWMFAFYLSGKNGIYRKHQSFQLPCFTCALQNGTSVCSLRLWMRVLPSHQECRSVRIRAPSCGHSSDMRPGQLLQKLRGACGFTEGGTQVAVPATSSGAPDKSSGFNRTEVRSCGVCET